jgi:hypothetical protein
VAAGRRRCGRSPVYDRMPVFDHFKKVDDTTLMGIMNGKLEAAFGVSDLYYFWLERDDR